MTNITIVYGTDQHLVLDDDTVVEVKDNTAFISRSGMIHLENCSTVTRMFTGMSVHKVTITTTDARQKLAKGAKGCASCERIAASRAAEYAENDQKIRDHFFAEDDAVEAQAAIDEDIATDSKAAEWQEALETDWQKIDESCSTDRGHEDVRWHAMMSAAENADDTMEERGYKRGNQFGTEHRTEWLEIAIGSFTEPEPDEITEQELAEQPKPGRRAQEVVIIHGHDGNDRVHASDCADVKRDTVKSDGGAYHMLALSREEVARDWYGDIAGDNHEQGTPEWEQYVCDCADMAMTFLPCCKLGNEEPTGPVSSPSAAKKLGKGQRRVLEFLKARPGQTMVVSLVVKGLEEQGTKAWWRATNAALAALAADPASGIVEVTGANKAYQFKA